MGKYLFFVRPVLELISQGKVFRMFFAIALRIVAVLVAITGLVVFIGGWTVARRLSATGILGLIISQLLFVAAIFIVVQIFFIRAKDISELPAAEFTVIPIFSIFLKLAGEICACFLSITGIGFGIFTWFAGGYAGYQVGNIIPLDFLSGSGNFISGVGYIVGGTIAALLALVCFYLMSELIVVTVSIAGNTRITREIVEQYDKTKQDS